MSNNIIDYDPLQEKIRSALSRASAVVRDLEAVMPYMPNTCQSLIGTIVEVLQNGGALQRTVARDLEHVIDHVEREITCGERHEIVADEHYAQGTYSQIVYTREADVNGGVKFGHCGGAKVGQFGASALERAALI
ncbi:hypothetical protein DSM110277_03755 (plasmid) [Sulfitobacter pontiacus]|uniref:Uncharacterized protein n=1 Tax=Sulfitobacter pontiacus TaxID=60137 RepID=A0AAX3AHP6_9RHOB|nr:hypothetical protein [Sulfitobacter pontiacus]UOA25301.1 hypothetical protein DSM110277_03755 [Sulfitobacter pontiacus]